MLNKWNFRKKEENVNPVVAPNANIYDQNKDIILEVEMPGVNKSTLDISLEGDVLTIRGKRDIDSVSKDYQLIHQERHSVEFLRSFEINTDIDRNDIQAEYADGVVKVILKKSEQVLPKKIEIKA